MVAKPDMHSKEVALPNEVQREIKKAKASYFETKLQDTIGKPRQLYMGLS